MALERGSGRQSEMHAEFDSLQDLITETTPQAGNVGGGSGGMLGYGGFAGGGGFGAGGVAVKVPAINGILADTASRAAAADLNSAQNQMGESACNQPAGGINAAINQRLRHQAEQLTDRTVRIAGNGRGYQSVESGAIAVTPSAGRCTARRRQCPTALSQNRAALSAIDKKIGRRALRQQRLDAQRAEFQYVLERRAQRSRRRAE